MVPYPASLPAEEAMLILITALRGQPVDVPQAVHVGWCAVGYGLAQGFPNTEGVKACSPEECAKMLEDCCKGGMKGFDWAILIPVILDLIQQFLKKK